MTIEDILTELGIQYRIIEDEAFAKCPFHFPDNHPSWSVNLNNGLHNCFSCGARGNLAYLLNRLSGLSYADAVIRVNEAVGHARMNKWREDYHSVGFSPMSLKVTEADMALFTDPPEESLESKNVTLEAANNYGIRWNPENESWIFPYKDPYSYELWGWQEKNARMFRNFPAGTRKSRTLFGYDLLYPKPFEQTAILVESPIDCAVMYSAGLWGMVSSFGIPNSFQLELIQRKCSKLILALDNDTPGKDAMRNLIPAAITMFDNVKVFSYEYALRDHGTSSAKDPGEASYDEINLGISRAIPALQWFRRNEIYSVQR
jgi:DNA primase